MNSYKKAFAGSIIAIVALTASIFVWKRTGAPPNEKIVMKLGNLPLSLGAIYVGSRSFDVIIQESSQVVSAPFEVSQITKVWFEPEPTDTAMADQLRSYFEAGDFYFSKQPAEYDVTRRLQRSKDQSVDDYFVTNQRMIMLAKLAKQNADGAEYNYVEAIKGLVRSVEVDRVRCMLISRHSPIRSGPRLQSRGTDAHGNASMTVETELVISRGDDSAAFTVVRGSIPFRWSQTRSWAKPIPTPQFSDDIQENARMMEKHLAILGKLYDGPVLGVSLVSFTGEEKPIGEMYAEVSKLVPNFTLHRFNYHAAVTEHKEKWGDRLLEPMRDQLKGVGFFSTRSGRRQNGVVRVNCLTVLDRTSVGQSKIMLAILSSLLSDLGISSPETANRIREWLNSAWVATADSISLQVGGTLAQQSDVIKHGVKTFGGKFKDAWVSLGRHWSSNKIHDKQFELMKLVHGYSD